MKNVDGENLLLVKRQEAGESRGAVCLSVCLCSALAATWLCGVEGQDEMPGRCVCEPGWQEGA